MSRKPFSEPARGVLLIAAAELLDPNFARTVVLLCEHQQQGSFGLVLNQRLPLPIKDVLTEPISWEASMYRGGPVEENTLHFLHRCPNLEIGSREIVPGIYWGGDFEAVRDLLNRGVCQPGDFRFFGGYSGWGEGQLLGELRLNSWYQLKATVDLVFAADPANLWRQAVRQLGPDYQIIANFPDDPRLN